MGTLILDRWMLCNKAPSENLDEDNKEDTSRAATCGKLPYTFKILFRTIFLTYKSFN